MTDAFQIPNLAGVIKSDDVFKKGHADFVAWARIANYLHEKAPGWTFELQPSVDDGLIHKAPDGSGFIVCIFISPDGQRLPGFPYACMDNRNKPIAWEKCDARVLTDAHRRGFCCAAAFTFGLGFELWAQAEVEDRKVEAQTSSGETVELGQTAQTALKAIKGCKTLDKLQALGERVQARHEAGDLSKDELQALLEHLLKREDALK